MHYPLLSVSHSPQSSLCVHCYRFIGIWFCILLIFVEVFVIFFTSVSSFLILSWYIPFLPLPCSRKIRQALCPSRLHLSACFPPSSLCAFVYANQIIITIIMIYMVNGTLQQHARQRWNTHFFFLLHKLCDKFYIVDCLVTNTRAGTLQSHALFLLKPRQSSVVYTEKHCISMGQPPHIVFFYFTVHNYKLHCSEGVQCGCYDYASVWNFVVLLL